MFKSKWTPWSDPIKGDYGGRYIQIRFNRKTNEMEKIDIDIKEQNPLDFFNVVVSTSEKIQEEINKLRVKPDLAPLYIHHPYLKDIAREILQHGIKT